jgi:hypothetical protein
VSAVPRIAAAAALLLAAAPSAAAVTPDPAGFPCAVDLVPVTWSDDDRAVLSGGPLADDRVPGADGAATLTLRCSLQDAWHADAPDLASASATGDGVVVLPPTPVTYAGQPWAPYLCHEVTVTRPGGASTTLYRDDETHAWTNDPAAACDDLFVACPDRAARSHDDCKGVATGPAVDAAVCPVLATWFPPEGDVEGVWDCPPYEG